MLFDLDIKSLVAHYGLISNVEAAAELEAAQQLKDKIKANIAEKTEKCYEFQQERIKFRTRPDGLI